MIRTAAEIVSEIEPPPLPMPAPGDVVRIGRAANYHFFGHRSIEVRIIRIIPEPVVEGVAWVHGYELSRNGKARRKRTIPVRVAGLIFTWPPP